MLRAVDPCARDLGRGASPPASRRSAHARGPNAIAAPEQIGIDPNESNVAIGIVRIGPALTIAFVALQSSRGESFRPPSSSEGAPALIGPDARFVG